MPKFLPTTLRPTQRGLKIAICLVDSHTHLVVYMTATSPCDQGIFRTKSFTSTSLVQDFLLTFSITSLGRMLTTFLAASADAVQVHGFRILPANRNCQRKDELHPADRYPTVVPAPASVLNWQAWDKRTGRGDEEK